MRVTWSPEGRLLATESEKGTVIIWDVIAGTVKHVLEAAGSDILRGKFVAMAWRPDGCVLAIGGAPGIVTLWDVTTCKQIRHIEHPMWGVVTAVAWSPCGRLLLVDTRNRPCDMPFEKSGFAVVVETRVFCVDHNM